MNSNTFKYWWSYLRANPLPYLLGLISVIICNICQVYFARALGYTIDFFSSNPIPSWATYPNQSSTFTFLFLSILIARFVLMLGRMGWRITLARQTHASGAMMKRDIWSNARYFSNDDLVDKYPKGVLMNAANSDVNQARFIFGFTLVGLVDIIFLALFSIISMLQINITLTLSSLILFCFSPYFIKKLSTIETLKYEKAQESLSSFNDLTSQAVATVKLQKLGQTSRFWFLKLFSSAQTYRDKRLQANLTSLKYIPYMGASSIVAYIVLFSLGIYLNLQGRISVGEFVAMQGLIFLLQDPITELGYIISEIRKSHASLVRLDQIYNNDSEVYLKGDKSSPFQGDFVYELKGVNFGYGESKILENFNLKVRKGSRIGITGQIGSGKTSLINILSGLDRSYKGVVKFYSKDFDSYSHLDLRSHITCVHQKPFLFAKSIKENVSMNQSLSDEQVWHYLEMAGLGRDVLDLEHGLRTELGEWGINLSGGQKQRLTLARALATRPKVLLLDDGLSAVDTLTERKILKNLDEQLVDTTIIWVAHRRSTLKYCQQIIDLDKQ